MINNLPVEDLCEKVFVSPICTANSDMMTRDAQTASNTQGILNQLRFHDGYMQDFLMFARTTTLSIRLVVLDYAGLSTSPHDVRAFIKNTKAIQELVVDRGHKLELIARARLISGGDIQKFDCRKVAVKRSTL